MINPVVNIRNALEAAMASIMPTIDIVYENVPYDPVPDQPYCEAYLLMAAPANPTQGKGFYQEQGVFQVNLQYPPLAGTLACALRAEMIRTLFEHGSTFASGGVTVQIDQTPAVGQGAVDSGRWKQIVRIRWHANIYS